MTATTDVLDAAYDRLGRWGFDEPNGYVNHAPMVCEALDALGRSAEAESWSHVDEGTPPAIPVAPDRFVWDEALGDPARAGEWMGHFERAIADDGWESVLHEWLPRLLPGMGVALYHGAIRSAHATRAIATADTRARRAELVRSLGYWAALFAPGAAPDQGDRDHVVDVELAIVRAAGDAARHYVARPNIINLHGVTSAMAVSILVRHTDEAAATAALAQLRAELRSLHAEDLPSAGVEIVGIDGETLVDAAIASGEGHAVKLVEAARRGTAATADPIFAAAAERVTRRGLRTLAAQDPSPAG